MHNKNMLGSVITALVTPMNHSLEIDFHSLTNLIEFQIKNKVDGLVVTGSTGEGSLLTFEEKVAVLKHVIQVVAKRVPIIMAFNDIATTFAVKFIQEINSIVGVDYYLATTPGYVRPTQDGLYEHFSAIATHSAHPLILYNIPKRTGCDLDNATIIRLVDNCPNIIAIKDATGDLSRGRDLVTRLNNRIQAYSGDDDTAAEFVLNGGDGVISVASNLIPGKFKVLMSNALADNKILVTDQNLKLKNLYRALSLETNPVALKWALFYKQIIKYPDVRLPLRPLTVQSQEIMQSVLTDLK